MKQISIILMIVAAIVLMGCTATTNTTTQDEKINVVVSILPQKAFVQAVGGDLVNVKELIPPGGSPATYDPKPSDLALVEKADIYFRIGHIPFEKSHMDKLIELNADMKVVDTSVNVELREFGEDEEHSHDHEEDMHEEEHADEEHEEHEDHDHSGTDPHIWLSPIQVKSQVDTIAKALSEKDPANSNTYKSNAENFKKELDDLHSEIQAEFTELKTDKLMVFHPAWGYFADEYGLEQISIEESGKEPTAQELQNIIEEAKEENIKVIFVQSQFNREIAESVAEQIGGVVVSIDPLSEDYLSNLKNIGTTIAENLN